MHPSSVGKAWRPYFQTRELSWLVPARVDGEYLWRFARSEWISKLLQHTIARPASNVRVLEAGCGTAIYGLSLALLGFNVDAFDYNDTALEFAYDLERKARQVKPDLQIRLSCGNLLAIQAESDSYDLVFNQAVLDYFCDAAERAQALREMMRVARRGRYVAAIVQHTRHPFRKYWERWGWEGYTNQPPVEAQTPARVKLEFEEAGLVNVIVDGIYPWKAFFFYPPWYQRWRLTNNFVYLLGQALNRVVPLPRTLRSSLALQFLVVGKKP